jgi:hypothetical protein
MKAGMRSCLVTLSVGLALAVPSLAQSLLSNGFRGVHRPAVIPKVTPCGPVFLTDSVSQDIITGNSFACTDPGTGFTFENHYSRAFDLPSLGIDGFVDVCDVDFAVEGAISIAGTQTVTVYLFFTPAGTFPNGPLTLIGTYAVDVPDQDLDIISVPVSATVPSGSELVVDVASEDGVVNGSAFSIGSNNLGQTAPSYLTAPDCGIATPTDLADIPPGFPNMQIVINALGTEYLAAVNPLHVDERSGGVASSNTNGVFEPGETVWVDPSWTNPTAGTLTFSTVAANFTGPTGPAYVVVDGTAAYGAIAPGGTSDCFNAAGDCYALQVTGARPMQHWDANFDEVESSLSTPSIPGSVVKTWTLHIGGSFADVPTSFAFYPFIENLFHHGVTGGCTGGNYCPGDSVTRAQMAVFLLKASQGSSYMPPPAAGIFGDVPAGDTFAPWIEDLYNRHITGGCQASPLLYCPGSPVTRAQMAAFLLKAAFGSSYTPPTAVGIFGDVPATDNFAPWIEDLYNRAITGGCQASPLLYCPGDPNTRGQMAVFLVKTFGLLLYGP